MKKMIVIALLAVSFLAHATDKKSLAPAKLDFRGVNVAQVIQLVYSELLKDAYVIDPDVLTDQRSVSFRYEAANGDLRAFVSNFLDSLGLVVIHKNGVDFVSRKQPAAAVNEVRDVFVYSPRYRDGSYLVDLLSPLFKGEFTARRTVHATGGDKSPQSAAPPGSAAAMIDRRSDTLVFAGSVAEIDLLKKLLAQVDKSAGDVVVRGVLYEVQTSNSEGSGFSLALSLLGGKLGVSYGPAKLSGNVISFTNSTIDAAVSALSADGRFTVKSTPTLRVASGQNGRFTVGQDVPVLGAMTYAGNTGTPVRSVEYRSSGVIFDLQPVLHEDGIELAVMQQVSNFVVTDTGVNDSPTLIKRELKTSLSLVDGELVVIGGLADSKESRGSNGLSFMPAFLRSKNAETSKSEILLILQLSRV